MTDEPTIIGCMTLTYPMLMPDNATCPCADCGTMLQHRPLKSFETMVKLCMTCLEARMIDEDKVEYMMNEEQIADMQRSMGVTKH